MSGICKAIDENLDRNWTKDNVLRAAKQLVILKQKEPEWIDYDGKRIYEAVIDCGNINSAATSPLTSATCCS